MAQSRTLQRGKPHLAFVLLSSLLLSFVYALFLYTSNTPMGPSYSSDSSIYMTMGTALAHYYRPYLDIWDHKGPVLFLLQWIPQSFGDGYLTFSIFIQEVLFLFLTLLVIAAFSARFFRVSPLLPQILYLAFTCSLVGEGNLSEEYTNLFTWIALYALFEVFQTETSSSLPSKHVIRRFAGIVGLCFMVCFLTRANNALPIAAFVFGMILSLIVRRQWSILLASASGFILGCLLILLPVVLWLAANGALLASYEASILHNILYSGTTSEYTVGRLRELLFSDYGHTALFFALLSLAGALCYLFTKSYAFSFSFALSSFASLLGAFISHKYYDHYLMLGIPLAVISGTLLLTQCHKWQSHTSWVKRLVYLPLIPCMLWLVLQCSLANSRRLEARKTLPTFFENAKSLVSEIPESERSSIYPYRVEPKWDVAAGVLPCFRYYFLQEVLADANPTIMDEIVAFFESSPPSWVVIYTSDRSFSPPYDPRVAAIFETKYEEVKTAGDYRLLNLRH